MRRADLFRREKGPPVESGPESLASELNRRRTRGRSAVRAVSKLAEAIIAPTPGLRPAGDAAGVKGACIHLLEG